MAEVQIRQLRKTYPGGVDAVRGIDCRIADGELLVMLGPSGCGKSTLLRMVAGLETITGGEVEIDGRVVNRLEPKDRDIAMVFQNYALYPHMSVFDNMAYGLKIRGMPKRDIEARVAQAAQILELSPYLSRKPRQLSGGQRQRVAMGRAIVREPKVFLFDEPLSNLDAKLRNQMRVEIRRLQRRLGITSLYVTHDQVEAMTLADRIMVMNGGTAEQIGTPMEIYHRPASVFVAGFIGSPPMNFLPAEIGADGRHVALEGGQRVPLPGPLDAGRPVTLGIRPEHLVPRSGGAPVVGDITLAIDLVEALGADTLAHGRIGDGGRELIARLPGGILPAAGDRMDFGIAPGEVHLFDPQSGLRIEPAPSARAAAGSVA